MKRHDIGRCTAALLGRGDLDARSCRLSRIDVGILGRYPAAESMRVNPRADATETDQADVCFERLGRGVPSMEVGHPAVD